MNSRNMNTSGNANTADDSNLSEYTINKFKEIQERDKMDQNMGFTRISNKEKLGWCINMHPTLMKHSDCETGKAAIDLYFLGQDGDSFKATTFYEPYFYVLCKSGTVSDVDEYIRKRFRTGILSVTQISKQDLSLPNHLVGIKQNLLKLTFHNISDLYNIKKILLPIAQRNQLQVEATEAYHDINDYINPGKSSSTTSKLHQGKDPKDSILDLREFDIPYYVRAAIDNDFRVGQWYSIRGGNNGNITITQRNDMITRAEPVVMAFDIETTKLPLKFPDASIDQIMMISYMIDGQGYLITNREIVSEDISDFEYTPKPEYEGFFTVFNEDNEKMVLTKFFAHIREAKPTIISTYNGDQFDWPFVDARAQFHGFSLEKEIGFKKEQGGEYKSFYATHQDCYLWVKRDSYLPQGSQGLKAVTKAKLGYDPMEVDPEDMTRFASEQPQVLAQYSVSDAVATYYLYMKYVNPFIFSLCNIIPMNPDEVLRRGSGTLCETLLMVEAYKADVIMPNKHVDAESKMYDGRLLDSETYVGGHVEALEAGVFRSDLETKFKLVPEAFQTLIDEVDAALKFSIEVEGNLSMDQITNYDEVREGIVDKLAELRDQPQISVTPLIYHLDVAAMYPNIILTNRLQPDAMVDERVCASCDFNEGADSECQRKMNWSWRGEIFPAKRNEYAMLISQLEVEKFPGFQPTDAQRSFHELRKSEQNALIKKRITEYSKKVYRKLHETKVIEKENIVCQRENSFYIDTVKNFRDRRYEYKGKLKMWKKKLDDAVSEDDAVKIDEAKKMIVVFDSLQLAHKCILNSFYGYVMRKGARWYSMEMAGIVCLTGAKIIQLARSRVEQIGRPLELDTDGIWCILPSTFPENFKFKLTNGKLWPLSYPCSMLNHLVHDQFTNHQYMELEDPEKHTYTTRSENSIFFEVDGPYKAMILPASTEADKLLKKRYAVFNEDGTIAELKGFELKRRGELKLVKIFQSQIFSVFLEGSTLQECYESVANVANKWLDILFSEGKDLDDAEVFDLISENRSMSRALQDYGSQKSTSISTAKRLAEFLGDEMVKDKGLSCKFIIASKPAGLPISERAIPVAIFQAERSVRNHYLRKWLHDSSLVDFDIRGILDWGYYLERFSAVIQKLITIPAAMQKISNPIPRVKHPDWLLKRTFSADDKTRQYRITEMFSAKPVSNEATHFNNDEVDIESDDDEPLKDIEEPDLLDVEDIVGPIKPKKTVKPKSKKVSQITSAPLVEPEIPPEPIGECPDYKEDFLGWLAYEKVKWKRQKYERSKRPRMAGKNVKDYFKMEKRQVFQTSWEVLQIVETEMPGEFRIWAIINNNLHSLRLIVPRIFYINNRTDDAAFTTKDNNDIRAERVNSILPRSHPTLNLYRMTMSERTYQKNLGALSGVFNHQDVEGVYETQVPLLFRSLIQLGCRISTRNNSILNVEDGFQLSDLSQEPTDNKGYLNGVNLNYLILFHTKTGSRHIYTLFSTCHTKAYVVYVDPAKNTEQIPNLDRVYKEAYDKFMSGLDVSNEEEEASRIFDYPEEFDFQVNVLASDSEARANINRRLGEYQSLKRGPTVLIICSTLSISNLMDGIFMIKDFPHSKILPHKSLARIPALTWQTTGIRTIMSLLFTVEKWIGDQVDLANYANVPMCNLDTDWTMSLMDIFLARKLYTRDMVLWYSPSEQPDLGGRQEDDHRYSVFEGSDSEINVPGAYHNITIDLNISNLAFNTIIQASLVNEMEGSASITTGYEPMMLMDGHLTEKAAVSSSNYNLLNPQTFTLIKIMIKAWFSQTLLFPDKSSNFQQIMLDNFYRWLKSTNSKLHDPALLTLIHDLMKKVFLQLLAQLKKVGMEIIYANFERVILNTSKKTLLKGASYAHFITETIKTKPVLSLLELRVEKLWEYLHWLDYHNNGGYCVEAPESSYSNRWLRELDEEKVRNLTKYMKWNIAEYLPPACKEEFLNVIGTFLAYVLEYIVDFASDTSVQHHSGAEEKANAEQKKKYMDNVVKQNLKRYLLKALPEMLKKWNRIRDSIYASDDEEDGDQMHTDHKETKITYTFPELPGSHLNLTNPCLELVKYICTVLGLDSSLEWEVGILRKDLLQQLDVRQFSSVGDYVNPCEKFILPQVICSYCGSTSDLDLTRDPSFLENEDDNDGGAMVSWRCRRCNSDYDRGMIEHYLVRYMQKRIQQWQLQDLECTRCSNVCMFSLRSQCACSGVLKVENDPEEVMRKVKVFKNIANYYNLELLKELINQIER